MATVQDTANQLAADNFHEPDGSGLPVEGDVLEGNLTVGSTPHRPRGVYFPVLADGGATHGG
jgi:hypothetical protein